MVDTKSMSIISKPGSLRPRWPEILLLGLCIGLCSAQLFIPPYIGLASNGDFARVIGRFALAPRDGEESNFRYFVSDYEFAPKNLWASEIPSSENLLDGIPILTAKAAGARIFNIRWAGAVHLVVFLFAYYAFLLFLRRYGAVFQLVIGGLALFIFTDVAYVSYLNSFFSDCAALFGLLLMLALALHLIAQQPARLVTVLLFTASALLFITSKTQHAVFAVFPAIFLLAKRRLVAGLLLIVAAIWMLRATPWEYPASPLFTVIFYKIAPRAPSPQAAIRELGLGEADYRYIGKQAFEPDSPTLDSRWLKDFTTRTSYAKVLRYWLRHPNEAWRAIHYDLATWAPGMRQLNLPNFRQQDGYPPGQLTHRFAAWSGMRDKLYRRYPLFIVGWYAMILAAALAVFVYDSSRRSLALICLGVSVMAILEFLIPSLTEANEMDRHLFLFHALTEVTIFFAAGWALNVVVQLLRPRRARVLTESPA